MGAQFFILALPAKEMDFKLVQSGCTQLPILGSARHLFELQTRLIVHLINTSDAQRWEVLANFVPLPPSLSRWRRSEILKGNFKGSSKKGKAPKAEMTQNAPSSQSVNKF